MFYYTNYSINATKNPISETESINLTGNYIVGDNGPVNLTLRECGCDSGDFIYICGETIMQSCTMNCNLTSSGTCFTIGADDLIIDGNGYWIEYSSPATSNALNNSDGFDNITIKNFVIKQIEPLSDFSDAIIFNNGADNGLIQNNTIQIFSNYTNGINIYSGNNNIVRDNQIFVEGDISYGIFLFQHSNKTEVSNNKINLTFSEEDGAGIFLVANYTNITGNIINSTKTYGIDISSTSFSTIERNEILNYKHGCQGAIYFGDYSINNTFKNNNITTFGDNSYSFLGGLLINAFFEGNKIIANGENSISFYFVESRDNILYNNQILSTGEGNSYSVYFWDVNNTNIYNTLINSTNSYDFYLYGFGQNNITNCTFNKSNIFFENNNDIYVKWYLDTYVRNSESNPVNGAFVTAYDNAGELTFNQTTNSSGYIPRQNVTEYFQNQTGQYYYTNYTENATKSGYFSENKSINLTRNYLNKNIVLTLNTPSGGGGEEEPPQVEPEPVEEDVCGDGKCTEKEDCTTCEKDCGVCPSICGNLICETEETYVTCPNDCCALQGQEITIIGGISSSATSQKCCSGLTAVDIYTNLTSCILTSETNKKVCINCGNRLCEAGENNCNCPTDCPVNCTSAGQTTKIENCCPGLTALRIYKDVENCLGISDEFICSNCGNAICENYENKCNCPTDCNITNVTLQWAISNFTMNCSDFTQGSFTLSIDTSITERVDIKLPVPCEYRTGISGCYPISECSYKDIPGFCGRLPTYNVIKSDKIDSLRNLFLENGTFNRTAIDINTTLLNATIPGQNTVLTPATDTEGTLDRTTAIGLSSDDSLYIKNKDKLNFAIGGTTATDFTFNADQDILNRLKFYKAIQYETFTTYGVENRCKLSCSNSPINQQVLESISNVAGKILNLQINKAYFYDCQGNSVGEGNYKCSNIVEIKCSITPNYEGWHAILSNGSAMRITTGNCAGARYYCPIESNPVVRFNQTIQKSQSTTTNTNINWIVAPAGISSADGLLQLTKADYVAEWNPATQSSKGAAYGKLYTTTTPRDPRTIEKIVISPEKLPLTGLATYPIGPISYPIYPIISEDVYITGNFNVTPGKPYFISYDKTQNNNLDSYDMIYMGDVPSPVTFDLRVGENYLVLPFNTTIKKASQLCKIADGTGKIISRSSTISRFNVNLQIVESAVEGYTCYEIDEQHLEDFDLIPGKVYRIDLDFGRSATWTQE